VRANGAFVNISGADFVFDNNYKLLSLTEVENYIFQHKHLPDISPATEMQTNGVNIGDMLNKLLQKIEELTLYSIHQDKENAELGKQLAEQKAQYDILMNKVEVLAKMIEKK
jgi:hypothetical protein